MLTTDLRRRPPATPVLYRGSIERSSISEADEEKGFLIVEASWQDADVHVDREFRRPLIVRDLSLDEAPPAGLESRVHGEVSGEAARCLSAAFPRTLAPPTMNIELRQPDARGRVRNVGRAADKPELPLQRKRLIVRARGLSTPCTTPGFP